MRCRAWWAYWNNRREKKRVSRSGLRLCKSRLFSSCSSPQWLCRPWHTSLPRITFWVVPPSLAWLGIVFTSWSVPFSRACSTASLYRSYSCSWWEAVLKSSAGVKCYPLWTRCAGYCIQLQNHSSIAEQRNKAQSSLFTLAMWRLLSFYKRPPWLMPWVWSVAEKEK